MKSVFLLLTVTSSLSVLGQSKPYFPNLTKISIDTTYDVAFGYDKRVAKLINKECYQLDRKDPLYCDKDAVLAEWTLVARFKSITIKDSLSIIYSAGMSADPGFTIATKTGKTLGEFSCTGFYINSSGAIYTSGHVNNMYNRRRKFQVLPDTVIEIKQPYNYVGLKGKALRDFVLYKDKSGDEIVAQIPKGYDVEVLLAESATKDFEIDSKFLVRTDFGLVGWLRLEGFSDQAIEGLYFAGD